MEREDDRATGDEGVDARNIGGVVSQDVAEDEHDQRADGDARSKLVLGGEMCSRRCILKDSEDNQKGGLANANEIVDNTAGADDELVVGCGQGLRI
jgi:hypothetical protein